LVGRVALTDDDPRGLAAADGGLVVSHFTSGRLSVVDVDRDVERDAVGLKLPSRAFFTPNQLDQLTLDPVDPGVVVVPHAECNDDPAQFNSGSTAFVGVHAAPCYKEGPSGFPAVVPGVSRAEVVLGALSSDDSEHIDQPGPQPEAEGPPCPIINPLNRTLLQDVNVNGSAAVAVVADGAVELVVARGSGSVVVRRTPVGRGQDSILGVIDAGVGADSIVLSPDGGTACVFNAFDQSVTRCAVPAANDVESRFAHGGFTADAFYDARYAPMQRDAATRFIGAPPALPEDVVRGRELFHAVDQRLTQNGAISCASRHPGGADDGTTWSFVERLRQSPPPWGGITGTAPFHWDGVGRDMADIRRLTSIGRMSGSGLGRDGMDAIGAFLDTIPAPAPPAAAIAATDSIERGAAGDRGLGCLQCHGGADLTDDAMHDVGTGAGFVARETMTAFATPSLKGLAHAAPCLHDGSSRTLRQMIDDLIVTGRMVGTSRALDPRTLTAAQKDDLVAELLSL